MSAAQTSPTGGGGSLHDLSERLGFGTAGLMGRMTRAESLRLLEAALDCGIRTIDSAPMYASGVAEGLVGEVLAGAAGKPAIITKVGILPRSLAPHRRALAKVARAAASRSAALRTAMPTWFLNDPRFHCFSPDAIVRSVQGSLEALRVERIDELLLHEVGPDDLRDEAVVETLNGLVQKGLVGTVGLATGAPQSRAIAASHPGLAAVLQLSINPSLREQEDLLVPERRIISNSVAGASFQAVLARMQADSPTARAWSAAFDADVTTPGTLIELFLNYAFVRNRTGVVLFSSTRPENIRQNVEWARSHKPDEGKAELLAALASGTGGPPRTRDEQAPAGA